MKIKRLRTISQIKKILKRESDIDISEYKLRSLAKDKKINSSNLKKTYYLYLEDVILYIRGENHEEV